MQRTWGERLHDLGTRFAREDRAAALLEFSLVAMMMVVLVFGTIDWTRFFLLRGQLADAIRDAARYAATRTEAGADSLLVVTYARGLMANTAAASSSGTVTVSYAGTAGVDRRVRVALAGFPYPRLAPFTMAASRTINVAAEFRREQP